MKTTARALNSRAAKYVASLPAEDPLAEANRLMDEAIRLQDCGKFAESEELIDRAEAIMDDEVLFARAAGELA
jgi:hypothetical protein